MGFAWRNYLEFEEDTSEESLRTIREAGCLAAGADAIVPTSQNPEYAPLELLGYAFSYLSPIKHTRAYDSQNIIVASL